MQRVWTYLLAHPAELMFGMSLVLIGYLIARLLKVEPLPALVFGLLPLIMAIGFSNPGVLHLVGL